MAEDQQLLPSPPFEHVPGLPNFRDLGGYPVVGSPVADPDPDPDPEAAGKTRTRTRTRTRTKMVRRHLIFRSSEPSRLTADGVARLQALGVERVYDLRSASEIARGLRQQGPGYPVKEWEGARRVFVPVFLDEDYSPEAMALRYRHYLSESPQGFVVAYTDMLAAAADPSNSYQPFKTILSHLSSASASPSTSSSSSTSSTPATSTPPPCLIHCTAGKDRTGLICALILSLCGVPDDVVAHEYSLTDLGLRSRHSELVAHILANPALEATPDSARRMVGAQKASMLGVLAKLRETYGSVEQCVLDLGLLSPEGISQLRSNLIVDADEDEVVPWQDHARLLLS